MRLPIFLHKKLVLCILVASERRANVCVLNMCRERAAAAALRPSLKQVRLHQGSPKFKSSQGGRRGAGGNLGAAAACHHSPLCMTYGGARAIMYFVIRIMAVQTCMPH